MKYQTFGTVEKATYKICILVPDIRKDEIEKIYIDPYGINKEDVLVVDLYRTPGKKKTPMADMKTYIVEELVDVLNDMGIEYVVIGDSEYFKAFTKTAQADRMSGYVVDSFFGNWKTVYVPNYRALFYDPAKIGSKIQLGMTALVDHINGCYNPPGQDIIKFQEYPRTVEDISCWLQKLSEMECDLTCDIEGFSLKHYSAGIGTITFCWNQEEGIAFPVDYGLSYKDAQKVRAMLKEFFINFKHKMIYHYISFDVMVLIYQLFMKNIIDTEGLLEGLEIMLRNWDDTKLIAYLATNSCAGNNLGLKDQAQEYAGNYAVTDINDITKIPLDHLLKYNLVDGLSTWYVHNKHYQQMIQDDQWAIYNNVFKPAIKDIIQMQLTGMPVDMVKVKEARISLQADYDKAIDEMATLPVIQQFEYSLLEDYTNKKNAEWKTKRMTIPEMAELAKTHEPTRDAVTFNPNSGPKLQALLYDMIGLPVIDKTDSKQPATGGETLEKLINHTKDLDVIKFLKALIDFKAVDKILSSFIPALENAQLGPDGWYYLFGNFNLGGTVSGRLSSSDPNLQNLPATGSKYAKLIKECFAPPPGWLFCGVDFNSLEDRISALTTKDPNKLKVYTDGYDGHSLRAYAYFGEQMPDIDPNSVNSINSIQKKYKSLRQDSKIPTFSLTYAGTYITIMNSQGWSKEKSQKIETAYHVLYVVSDNWVKEKLDQATKDGYVTCAFGLRVRTPLLHQVVRGTRKTPFAAEAEGRTAGNALGQSWCLLNSRAASEFMGIVRKSKYRLDIRPCAQIHDANYALIRDDLEVVQFANEHLINAVQWQDDPEIAHDEVKLGGEFTIFHPNWSKEIGIPNGATTEEITVAIQNHYEAEAKKLAEKQGKPA